MHSPLSAGTRNGRTGWLRAGIPFAAGLSVAALVAAGPASPQTVSCAEAAKPAEFAICNSEKLQSLDQRLDDAYRRDLAAAAEPQRRRLAGEQDRWLGERDACAGDFECLEASYGERLGELMGDADRRPVPITTFKRFADTARGG